MIYYSEIPAVSRAMLRVILERVLFPQLKTCLDYHKTITFRKRWNNSASNLALTLGVLTLRTSVTRVLVLSSTASYSTL